MLLGIIRQQNRFYRTNSNLRAGHRGKKQINTSAGPVLKILGQMCKLLFDASLLPIRRWVSLIAAGYFHTPRMGARLSPQINAGSGISLNVCPAGGSLTVGFRVSRAVLWGCSPSAPNDETSAALCVLSLPSGGLDERPLKVKVGARCCTPDGFTFAIRCLWPSAPHGLSLPVTAASLAARALSSGGAAMEERGTDVQPRGLQWRHVIGSSGNKGAISSI